MIRLALPLMAVAVPALAEGGPTPAEVTALIRAVAAQGCDLTEANQAEVLRTAGLTADIAAGVVQKLEDEGRLLPRQGNVLHLIAEGCV